MRRRVKMALLVPALGLVLCAQLSEASGLPGDADPPIDVDTPRGNATTIVSTSDVGRGHLRFELSKVSDDIVKAFEQAWTISNNGTSGKEGLVLIFQAFDGGYLAQIGRKTNELRQVTFTWVPNAIAVVHTHPNRNDPKPSNDDIRLADRFKVPMITITLRGLYVYDPVTKKTTQEFDGLDWLDASKWAKRAEPKQRPDLPQR